MTLLFAPLAQAAYTGYSSSAAFFAALAGQTVLTEGYEAQTTDSTIADGSTLNGLTYSFSAGIDGRVDSNYNKIGNNSLGAAGSPGFFLQGDSITVTFDQATTAFGVFFNIDDSDLASVFAETNHGDYHESGGGYDFDTFYFVGIVSDTTFTSVTFGALLSANSGFNVDDLSWVQSSQVVPTPGSLALLSLGLLAAGFTRRRSTT
jgi:hypothetical protein